MMVDSAPGVDPPRIGRPGRAAGRGCPGQQAGEPDGLDPDQGSGTRPRPGAALSRTSATDTGPGPLAYAGSRQPLSTRLHAGPERTLPARHSQRIPAARGGYWRCGHAPTPDLRPYPAHGTGRDRISQVRGGPHRMYGGSGAHPASPSADGPRPTPRGAAHRAYGRRERARSRRPQPPGHRKNWRQSCKNKMTGRNDRASQEVTDLCPELAAAGWPPYHPLCPCYGLNWAFFHPPVRQGTASVRRAP